ncbi:T121 protein [Hirschfeldia incana]|nr:T121 protein [Hirschfeldia incana]
MLVLRAPTGPVSAVRFITKPKPRIPSSDPWLGLAPSANTRPRRRVVLTLSNSDSNGSVKSAAPSTPKVPDDTVFVGQENVPLEGVIQFDKPKSNASIKKWSRVALLAGGDVLALLIFSAIGRFSHGFPVFSFDTLHTADPFIAGWFLSAYFLGGYGEEGRGMKGQSKAVLAAAKSWAFGVPLGVIIRSTSSGHIPAYSFILVTMGSTAVLLIGWRALLFSVLPSESKKKDDTYRKGSAFELFELLTSLIRRW